MLIRARYIVIQSHGERCSAISKYVKGLSVELQFRDSWIVHRRLTQTVRYLRAVGDKIRSHISPQTPKGRMMLI